MMVIYKKTTLNKERQILSNSFYFLYLEYKLISLMGIPKKESRKITTNNHNYRYTVSGNDTLLDLIIESNEINSQRLVVSYSHTPHGIDFSQSHSNQICSIK